MAPLQVIGGFGNNKKLSDKGQESSEMLVP